MSPAKIPFVAIYEDSDEPTETEIVEISKLIIYVGSRFGAKPGAAGAVGANMVTIRKTGDRWMYRHMSWSQGWPWSPDTKTLEDIQRRL